MEVEVSRKSLDYARYWLVALVADNSHVSHLNVEGRPANWAPDRLVLSPLMPRVMVLPGMRKCGKSEQKVVKQHL